MATAATRPSHISAIANGQLQQIVRPDFEAGDRLAFGDCVPAGWQLRRVEETDIPPELRKLTKPFMLLRRFPGLATYREFVNLPPVRQRGTNLSRHAQWAWRRACRLDPRKAVIVADLERRHRELLAEGAAWPEGQPDPRDSRAPAE